MTIKSKAHKRKSEQSSSRKEVVLKEPAPEVDAREFLKYSSLLTRHVAPCKMGWLDLEGSDGRTAPILNVKGFALNINKDGDDEMLMVNGVEIAFPDMYESERLVIHGIKGVIALPELDADEELLEEFSAQQS